MATKRPATIAEYIRAAPRAGQPHLRRMFAILRNVAPDAQALMKWNTPFFVEPRFLFAFSAHKAHCNFAPIAAAMQEFHDELKEYRTTKNYLQIRYDEPLPEDLIRRIAEYCVRTVHARTDNSFW